MAHPYEFPGMSRPLRAALAACCLLVAAACDDDDIPAAQFSNTQATVRVHAFNSAPPTAAVGLLLADVDGSFLPRAVRLTPAFFFDIAFEFDEEGTAHAFPVKLLASNFTNLREVGLQHLRVNGVPVPFDEVRLAPTSARGYIYSAPVEVAEGDVLVVDSNNAPACAGNLFFRRMFAKMRVDDVDPVGRTVTVTVLANPNCGYRGLEPGVPRE